MDILYENQYIFVIMKQKKNSNNDVNRLILY